MFQTILRYFLAIKTAGWEVALWYTINQKLKVIKNKKIIFSSTEPLHMQIECNGKLTSVLGVYEAPQRNANAFIVDIKKKWLNGNQDHDITVAGDVNID